ncbi:MAG: PEP-CTERM sorting domain-containing protein, partial [Burkholderiales bacterium]
PADYAWSFETRFGAQYSEIQSNGFFAWAVRDGDVTVAAVPVPGSVALLAGGLALLGVVTRRRGRLGASEA